MPVPAQIGTCNLFPLRVNPSASFWSVSIVSLSLSLSCVNRVRHFSQGGGSAERKQHRRQKKKKELPTTQVRLSVVLRVKFRQFFYDANHCKKKGRSDAKKRSPSGEKRGKYE